jgi:hypothetical protein
MNKKINCSSLFQNFIFVEKREKGGLSFERGQKGRGAMWYSLSIE